MRSLSWMGSSRKDLKTFPSSVQRKMGYALYLAQTERMSPRAKPLKGFAGAGVIEVAEDFDGDTYRAVYTLTLSDAVFVLHAFQKKSTSGISTPQREIDLIRQRLKRAEEIHTARRSGRLDNEGSSTGER
jgi:phage-related protein